MKKSTAEKILALLEKGWKAKEIAEKLNVSTAYVYVTKSKANKSATKIFNEYMEMAPPKAGKADKEVKSEGAAPPVEPAKPADMVNHPPHYTVGGIETLDFIEAKGLGYNLGNVVKYIARAYWKGDELQDLQKARFYLDRQISNLSK